MKVEFPKINQLGERAILIEFESEINENTLKKLLFIKKKIQNKYSKEKVEVINTYNSILINYPLTINNFYDRFLMLKQVVSEAETTIKFKSRLFHIPVCYESKFGFDLEIISAEKNLTFGEIIKLHTAPVYTVYFIGFLPGFLYLGGLDKRLHFSRKNQPRLRIEKGAVGIGGSQTGIYPKSSPGGWQIIGNSPIQLFDKNNRPPCEISSGDKVKFYPISEKEHLKIQKQTELGNFRLKNVVYEE